MNKPLNPALSHSISELRFPLAALVVFGHANVLSFPLTDIHSTYNIIQYPILLLSQILFYPAVPLFFIISGILFFWNVDSYGHDAWKSKMCKRMKTLLLPYLVWNILYDIPYTAKDFITNGGNNALMVCFKSIINLWFWTNQTDRLTEFAMTTPIDPPLWFVRDLFVCMLLSGVLYKLLRKKVTCFLLLGALFIWWMSGKFQYIFPGISVPAFLFFGFGSAIGIWKVDFMNFFKRYKTIVFVASSCSFIVIFLTTHYKIETDGNFVISNIEVLNSLYIIVSIPAYLLVADRLSKCKLTNIEGLATASFTLYACHWLVLDIMRRIIHRLIQGEIAQGEMMLVQFTLYIVPCLIAIALYSIIKRDQRLKLLLSGGR